MFKYFTKSPEMSIFYPHDEARTNKMRANYLKLKEELHPEDAIGGYKIARFLGTSDCIWSIFSFELYYLSQTVVSMDLHLPSKQIVYLRDNRIVGKAERTMLTSFFELNEQFGDEPLFLNQSLMIKDLLYEELPQFFVWDASAKMWTQRCRALQQATIGRVHKPADSNPEMFSLRLMLQNVKGPKSFKELLNGAATFVQAAGAIGLLSDEAEFEHYMMDVIDIESPAKCRHIFADLLMSVSVPNPVELWVKLKKYLSQDFQYKIRASADKYAPDMCSKHALWCINESMFAHGTNLLTYGFSKESYNLSLALANSKPLKLSHVICTAFSDYKDDDKTLLNDG